MIAESQAVHPFATPGALALQSGTPLAEPSAVPVAFDDEGFLVDPAAWTPALAERLALLEGMDGLRARHWEIITVARERYLRLGALPVMRLLCRAARVEPGAAHRLFRNCRTMWRIAGLPDPGAEARAYMN